VVGFGGDERLGRGEGGYGGFVKGIPWPGLVSLSAPSGVISSQCIHIQRT